MKLLKPSEVRAQAGPLVCVVDEAEGFAELCTLFLKGTGCVVRAYNYRADALAALTADRMRPDLLIMDQSGESAPVDWFLQRCLVVHPGLRILMVSQLSQRDVVSSCICPHRFIQKPFTADEFLQEVSAAFEHSSEGVDIPCAHEVFSCIQVRINQ